MAEQRARDRAADAIAEVVRSRPDRWQGCRTRLILLRFRASRWERPAGLPDVSQPALLDARSPAMKQPFLFALPVVCLLTAPLWANDWPQFRYDSGRTAASPHELPADLQLRWTRKLPAPRPAFPFELRLGYDASYEPVVLGNTMFVPSMVTDSVTALDAETGAERWRFFAEAPVRFAPAASEGKVYFVSDDGYLCLDADDGSCGGSSGVCRRAGRAGHRARAVGFAPPVAVPC